MEKSWLRASVKVIFPSSNEAAGWDWSTDWLPGADWTGGSAGLPQAASRRARSKNVINMCEPKKYYPEIFFRTACIWRDFCKYWDKTFFDIIFYFSSDIKGKFRQSNSKPTSWILLT